MLYKVDFSNIENKAGVDGKNLNKFEREVYSNMGVDKWEDVFARIDLDDKLKKILTYQEHRALKLYLKYGRQKDAARIMGCSQAKIARLIKSAKRNIKNNE